MLLSIVVPVMNEEGNVQPLIARVAEALAKVEHELIFVDDGSNDRTVAEIERFARQIPGLWC